MINKFHFLMMTDSNFAKRLNLSLDKAGVPPKNKGRIQILAEMVGLTHRGASKWINGESTPPKKKFNLIAKKLNVNETWLRSGEGSMNETSDSTQSNKSFLIDVNIYDLDTFLSPQKTIIKTIKCTLNYESDFFGIILNTQAMSPRFPPNSIIIFDSKEAKDGDFVLVNYDSFPSPIFRQLFIINSTLYLNAHNPKFERIILPNKDMILGKLVQAILSFE